MLRQEEDRLVLYAIRLDMGRMKSAQASEDDVISSEIGYDVLIGMIRSALDSPYMSLFSYLLYRKMYGKYQKNFKSARSQNLCNNLTFT